MIPFYNGFVFVFSSIWKGIVYVVVGGAEYVLRALYKVVVSVI